MHRESAIKSQARMRKAIFFHGILSRDIEMHRLFENIKRAAQTGESIYISGETGVGKELVARAIHAESKRAQKPFIAVNVANFSSDLIESQLFGHIKGAFTGAVADSKGFIRAAAQGTLFLDEVTCLSPKTQASCWEFFKSDNLFSIPKAQIIYPLVHHPDCKKKIQESLVVFDHSPGQVLLELSIVEITSTDISRLGIRWHDNNASLAQGIISDQPDLI